MDRLNKGNLHGIQVAVSSIISSYLYKDDYQEIVGFLRTLNKPTTLKEINITFEEFIDIILNANNTRPNKYTILDEIDLEQWYLKRTYNDLFLK